MNSLQYWFRFERTPVLTVLMFSLISSLKVLAVETQGPSSQLPTLHSSKTHPPISVKPLPNGSISREEGLKSWEKIFQVASHPRCANCHVGKSDRPMWSGPSYGKAKPHGMNIRAGASRIGAETLLCSTCHSKDNVTLNHSAPGVAAAWQLAPIEAHWYGKTSSEICEQLRDPKRNGNRTAVDIARHLDHDLILHWAWNPGGNREPAPFSLQEHVNDILRWGAAEMPCPSS